MIVTGLGTCKLLRVDWHTCFVNHIIIMCTKFSMRRKGYKHGRNLACHAYSTPWVYSCAKVVLESKEMHTRLYPQSLNHKSKLLNRPKGIRGCTDCAFVLCPKPINASFRSKSSERYGFHFCRPEWRTAFRTFY